MNWLSSSNISENQYNIPGNWLYVHYFEALNILFRIENALRIFVYIILKQAYKEKWVELNITSDDDAQSTILSISRKRQSQDNNFEYLGYNHFNPLMYLTSGELIRIITSDSYWQHFKPHFMGSKETMKMKLDEIGNVRNCLAHFRPIKNGDVEVLKQNAHHTLDRIENNISQIINSPVIVPSNTKDDWYNKFSILGTTGISFKFRQSKDEKWVKLILEYSSKIIAQRKSTEKTMLFRITRLLGANIISNYPTIRNNVIITNEETVYNRFDVDNPIFTKNINFIFSKNTLSNKLDDLKEEFDNLFKTINEESELLSTDNLAKGSILESIYVTAEKEGEEDDSWFINRKNLIATITSEHPEYWGRTNYISDNFISDSENYPWMQARISEDKSDDLPF